MRFRQGAISIHKGRRAEVLPSARAKPVAGCLDLRSRPDVLKTYAIDRLKGVPQVEAGARAEAQPAVSATRVAINGAPERV